MPTPAGHARNHTDADSETNGQIRLAYLSPDLGGHAVGGLLKDLFAHHDARGFSVCVFSLRNFDDAIADQIRADAHQFEDLSKPDLDAAAERIATFAPDILIDLGGYTQGSRTELLAMRLAPVQMSWLGYLNTMGAGFIDYLIADDVVLPSEHEDRYDEKIARLPRCFLPYSHLSENALPLTRKAAGLPDDVFVFASFNNPCKVQPAEFRAWVRILREVPASVLWIYDGDREAVRQNLIAAFELAGLAPARLVFASMLPMNEHLQRMKLADLFLDTFRYNAGATAIAAAQVGLPVLTVKGDSLLARMGASINLAMGLDELVCGEVDEYVQRAIELALNPEKTVGIRKQIAAALENGSGLFDTAGFVADLEALLKNVAARK